MNVEEEIGKTYNRWKVLRYVGQNSKGERIYTCECQCSKKSIHNVRLTHLKSGRSKSCGCLRSEHMTRISTKHGRYYHPLYQVYTSMIQRCNNPNAQAYKNYGAIGRKVCEEWSGENGFINFYSWAVPNYEKGLTLDRIDNIKGYSPDNCRWVTMKVQRSNSGQNRFITFRGRTQTLTQWAEEIGLSMSALRKRIDDYNWPIEKALTVPLNGTRHQKRGKYKNG